MDVLAKILLFNLDSAYADELKTQLHGQGFTVEQVCESELLEECQLANVDVLVASALNTYWLATVARANLTIFLVGDFCIDAQCWPNVEVLPSNYPIAVLVQKIARVSCCANALTHNRTAEALAAQVKHLKAELERTIAHRDDFLSMASHELRTPLNGLVLDTQLRKLQLSKGNLAIFTEERMRQMIERDEHQLLAMVRLVDDMLDSSHMRTGQLSISVHHVELNELVEELVERFALRFELAECPLKMSFSEAVSGCWDGFRVEQIVSNLLTNALRYGRGGAVEVTVWKSDEFACVSVKDHGVGIAEADKLRVFGEFERAVAHSFAPGLGLGLFISEQIAKAHGGCIELESEEGVGSTFTLKLPL